MKNIIYVFLVFVLIITGCSKKENNTTGSQVNFNNFRMLALQAASGDSASNRKLGYFINPRTDESYTNILVDVYQKDDKHKFYYVLVEYLNPLFNRFAVFDNYLNLYLVDKSLNGNLSYENGSDFIKIKDGFVSKDIISIQRISLYKVDTTSVRMVLRTYEQIMTPKMILSQEISRINSDSVITTIISPVVKSVAAADTFIFNKGSDKFLSRNNFVEKIVKSEIDNFKGIVTLPELK